jgi:hypothetical protein
VAKRTDGKPANFDEEALAEFRRRFESRFVALEYGDGPRFRDLPEDEREARFAAALRARARWAPAGDFSHALVKPAKVTDRPKAEE